MTDRPVHRVARHAGRAAVACLALATLALAGSGAIDATISGAKLVPDLGKADDADAVTLTQFEMLRKEMAAKVPRGSTMCIVDTSSAMWEMQRLAEFAALNGLDLIGDCRRAEYTVRMGDPRGKYFHLVVTHNG